MYVCFEVESVTIWFHIFTNYLAIQSWMVQPAAGLELCRNILYRYLLKFRLIALRYLQITKFWTFKKI